MTTFCLVPRPDLAAAYATRTIELTDGHITTDSGAPVIRGAVPAVQR